MLMILSNTKSQVASDNNVAATPPKKKKALEHGSSKAPSLHELLQERQTVPFSTREGAGVPWKFWNYLVQTTVSYIF